MTTKPNKGNKMHAVITTDKRGVFFGEIDEADREKTDTMTVKDCQMCVYWASGGVVGLASDGPPKGSRITKAAPSITLHDIHSVMEASPEAVKAWQRSN